MREFRLRNTQIAVFDRGVGRVRDVSDVLDQKWAAIQKHKTQMSLENPFLRFGRDAWRDFWAKEAYILRESRIPTDLPETDLFAGLT